MISPFCFCCWRRRRRRRLKVVAICHSCRCVWVFFSFLVLLTRCRYFPPLHSLRSELKMSSFLLYRHLKKEIIRLVGWFGRSVGWAGGQWHLINRHYYLSRDNLIFYTCSWIVSTIQTARKYHITSECLCCCKLLIKLPHLLTMWMDFVYILTCWMSR